MSDIETLKEFHQAHYDTLLRLARNRLRHAGVQVADADRIVLQAFQLAMDEGVLSHDDALAWLCQKVDMLCKAPA